MDMDNPPRLFTVEEVAQALRTTPTVIRRAINAGRLHAIKVGGEFRIPQGSIDAFVAAQTTTVEP